MHIDLDQTAPHSFSSTVCIVGAGIAGLILATRLAAAGIHVHLLEAGGLKLETRSQVLFATEHSATVHLGATEGRFRTFGGSSTRWGAQLLPFTPDVFDKWPISEADLAPYYPEIESLFAVDQLPFDATLLPALKHQQVPFSNDITLRFSKWAPFSKRNLAQTLGQTALAHPNITVFTHANVAELLGSNDRIEAVRVLNYSRAEFHFTAKHFILAAGTVESCRLLLSSPAVPNPCDQIGRNFHDHLSFHAAQFTSPTREAILHRLGPFFTSGTLHTCKFEASPSARERENLLNVMAHLVIVEPEDSGAAALRNLLRLLQSGNVAQAFTQNLAALLREIPDVLRLAVYARFRHRRAVSKRAQLYLNIDVEQSANTSNCIRISANKDALGLPIAVIDWRIHPPEQHTAVRFAALIRRELEALELAPTVWDESMPPPLVDTYHAMGGLLMGTDPTTSVVTPDLSHHQLENLYIASCATFPTGSSSNPTFTLIALAMRLADHLVSGA